MSLMNVITINEFESNQNHFLEMARKGMDVVLKSKIFGSFKIVPISTTDAIEAIDDNDPNDETIAAIEEATQHADSIRNGANITETVDLSSVEAMLKSCGV